MRFILFFCTVCTVLLGSLSAEAQIQSRILAARAFTGPVVVGGPTPQSGWGYDVELTAPANAPIVLSSIRVGLNQTYYYRDLNDVTKRLTWNELVPMTFTGSTYVTRVTFSVDRSGAPVNQFNRLFVRVGQLVNGRVVTRQLQVVPGR